MVLNTRIETDLEMLRQELPDPFFLPDKLDEFFANPVAQQLIAKGTASIKDILSFLVVCTEPSLARVAVLLLSTYEPSEFYQDLLAILKNADEATSEAFEDGMWRIKLPDEQIAKDLVNIVSSSGNPNPLLLLQRSAVITVKSELAGFIKTRQLPLSLYSLYCYGYALEKGDNTFLTIVSGWVEIPEISSLAGLYLLRLGSKDGTIGIWAGLVSPDVQLRTITYYELFKYLPDEVVDEANYDPAKCVESQQPAMYILMKYLTRN